MHSTNNGSISFREAIKYEINGYPNKRNEMKIDSALFSYLGAGYIISANRDDTSDKLCNI